MKIKYNWYIQYKKSSLDYLDIGHSKKDKPTLWGLTFDGDFITKEVKGGIYGHENFEEYEDNCSWSGRFIKNKDGHKIVSAMPADFPGPSSKSENEFSKRYISIILKEHFGNDIIIKWF